MSFLDPSRNNNLKNSLLNVENNRGLLNSFTVLQNEIGVYFDTKVIGVTSIKLDEVAAAFAKGFADAYKKNGAKVLIIDANLYSPLLKDLLDEEFKVAPREEKEIEPNYEDEEELEEAAEQAEEAKEEVVEEPVQEKVEEVEEAKEEEIHPVVEIVPAQLVALNESVSVICLNQEIYPSEVYKSGLIQKLIKDNEKDFDHIIVLVPSVRQHKEVVLLKDVLTAIILLTQKNLTRKENIYNALQFFAKEELPLAKTVVLK